jgi:hypothetical protein
MATDALQRDIPLGIGGAGMCRRHVVRR